MIEVILIFALATFINISGVKAATNLHESAPTQRAIVTVEDFNGQVIDDRDVNYHNINNQDVNNEKPQSLLEALQKLK